MRNPLHVAVLKISITVEHLGGTHMDTEHINSAISNYKEQVMLSHMGLPSDPHYQTIADGMRRILYTLGILNDESNHQIIESAKKKADKISRSSR
jgi:hypothetical protein